MENKNQAYREAATVEELTEQNVRAIIQLEQKAKASRTVGDKAAAFIARFCGSMTFVWSHVIWFGLWIGFNVFPREKHFDPYPFTFLTLVVSLEAIFLATFILISQNHDARIGERRNQLDLQVNLLAEQENTKMLALLERIGEKLGIVVDDDPTVHILDQATRPDTLVEQIDRASRLDGRTS